MLGVLELCSSTKNEAEHNYAAACSSYARALSKPVS